MNTKITRRALCAGLAAVPIAMSIGAQAAASASTGFETTAATVPSKDVITRVIEAAAAESSLTPVVILSSLRTREAVAARQKGLYLAYVMSGKSLPEIGRRFGGRDHTTVLHAVRKIGALRNNDPSLRAELSRIARAVDPDGTIRMTWQERV